MRNPLHEFLLRGFKHLQYFRCFFRQVHQRFAKVCGAGVTFARQDGIPVREVVKSRGNVAAEQRDGHAVRPVKVNEDLLLILPLEDLYQGRLPGQPDGQDEHEGPGKWQ